MIISATIASSRTPMMTHAALTPGTLSTNVPWNCFFSAGGASPLSSKSLPLPE